MAARRTNKLLAAGAVAPDFRMETLDGGAVSLLDLGAKGRAVLAFFKVSCPVCQMTFPFLERIHAAGNLPIFGVSQNDADDTREFNREFGITLPMLLDSEDDGYLASNAYGISSVPTLFVVESGKIGRVSEGWSRKDIEWLGAQAGVEAIRQTDRVPEHKPG